MTDFASGRGLTCFISSRNATPSNTLSMRLHEVTQWTSQPTVIVGNEVNSCQQNSTSLSTRPNSPSRQLLRSTRGVPPYVSTGQSSTTFCPGGRRSPHFSRSSRRRERIFDTIMPPRIENTKGGVNAPQRRPVLQHETAGSTPPYLALAWRLSKGLMGRLYTR